MDDMGPAGVIRGKKANTTYHARWKGESASSGHALGQRFHRFHRCGDVAKLRPWRLSSMPTAAASSVAGGSAYSQPSFRG